MKPYTKIYSGNTSTNIIDESELGILKAFEKHSQITFDGFSTKGEAKQFVDKFPKYIKIYLSEGSWVERDENNVLQGHRKYEACIEIGTLNDVTGEVNETGQKRVKGLIKTLKKLGYIS